MFCGRCGAVWEVRQGDDVRYRAAQVCESGRIVFFFNDTATTEIYTLSLHDALPI